MHILIFRISPFGSTHIYMEQFLGGERENKCSSVGYMPEYSWEL